MALAERGGHRLKASLCMYADRISRRSSYAEQKILLTRHRRERTLRVLSALQTEAENLGGTADLIRP